MYDELLAYLEADLAGLRPQLAAKRGRCADPGRLLARVAELANDDWSQAEAVSELGQLASLDGLRAAHTMVLGSLMRDPFVDAQGIRMARILIAALDEQRVPLRVQGVAVPRRRLLARLFRAG